MSNQTAFTVYIAAAILLGVSLALRPLKIAAKGPNALIGLLTLAWLLSWFGGMVGWLVILFVTESAIFPLWVYLIIISFGLAALASALLLIIGEAIRTARVVMRR
jgi:hypothetical protein